MVQLASFVSDGLYQVLVDEKDKFEAGDFQDRVVAKSGFSTSMHLSQKKGREKEVNGFFQLFFLKRTMMKLFIYYLAHLIRSTK